MVGWLKMLTEAAKKIPVAVRQTLVFRIRAALVLGVICFISPLTREKRRIFQKQGKIVSRQLSVVSSPWTPVGRRAEYFFHDVCCARSVEGPQAKFF